MKSLIALFAMLLVSAPRSQAQTRESLFDGKTLAGWHIQGPGLWTVKDGVIQGANPTKQWGHLITDKQYGNGYVRLRFWNKVGNSGLYVRSSQGGAYGVKGMQVDIGTPHNDGSVMRVTDSTYTWFQEITKAQDSGWLKDGWNELAAEAQGASLKTWVNGHAIWSQANVAGMAATGSFALQLHSGANNDIQFKDIDLFLPTRIPYCADKNDPAYKAGNDPDPSLCKNPVGLAPRSASKAAPSGPSTRYGFPAQWNRWFDLRGARLPRVLSLP